MKFLYAYGLGVGSGRLSLGDIRFFEGFTEVTRKDELL